MWEKLEDYLKPKKGFRFSQQSSIESSDSKLYLITSGHSSLMGLAGIEYQESRRNQESFFWSTYFWMVLYNRFIIPLGKIVLFVWVWYLPCLPNFLEPCAKDFVQTQSE